MTGPEQATQHLVIAALSLVVPSLVVLLVLLLMLLLILPIPLALALAVRGLL